MGKAVKNTLNNGALGVFFENMAMMLAAGIGSDEASAILAEGGDETEVSRAAVAVRDLLFENGSLAQSIRKSGCFPEYAARMVEHGEYVGRTEEVMRQLAVYYARRQHTRERLNRTVVYPLVLLCIMMVILAMLLVGVLPVFSGVYTSLAGGLAGTSGGYLKVGYMVGGIALVITAVVAVTLLAFVCVLRGANYHRAINWMARFPITREAATQIELVQFINVLAVFMASGMDELSTLDFAYEMIKDGCLGQKVKVACDEMHQNGKSLADAIYGNHILPPMNGRMLLVASRSGNTEKTIEHLAKQAALDEDNATNTLIDTIEPILSGFLTLTVGITLLAVMLPLVGILGAIG